MAVPKRRHSNQRTAKRRTHWKAQPVAVGSCSHCGQSKRPHRVCPSCGYYGDREVTSPSV